MPWTPDKIPIWLRRSPEQQAADNALQERLKTAYGPGVRPTPTERHLMRARAVELSARAELENLALDPGPDPKHIESAAAQLAEARAMQGHYHEAAALHPKLEHAERFQAIAEAVDRPDEDHCGCQPQRVAHPTTGKTITLEAENVDEMVFDPRRGKLMPLVRCTHCGDLNVKPAPPKLQQRIENIRRKED